MKRLIPILLLLICIPNSSAADGFTAVCQSDEVHAFRYDSDLNQDTGKGEWNTEEKFPGEWHFFFNGTELTVDGKSTILLPTPAGILIAVDYSSNSVAGSLWAYVILLEQQKIGAAQVNGSSLPTKSSGCFPVTGIR